MRGPTMVRDPGEGLCNWPRDHQLSDHDQGETQPLYRVFKKKKEDMHVLIGPPIAGL